MIEIAICVGSACHLKGSYQVMHAFKSLLELHRLEGRLVELKGAFCQGDCTEGVVVHINGEIITRVSQDKVFELFQVKVLGRQS